MALWHKGMFGKSRNKRTENTAEAGQGSADAVKGVWHEKSYESGVGGTAAEDFQSGSDRDPADDRRLYGGINLSGEKCSTYC